MSSPLVDPCPIPVPCRRCGDPTEPVGRGRWVMHPSICARCSASEAAERRAGETRRVGAELLGTAGVPAGLQCWTFDRTVVQSAGEPWAAFRDRVRSSSPPVIGINRFNGAAARVLRGMVERRASVYLSGHVGGGKSTLAAAGIRRLCEAGVSVHYLEESTLWGMGAFPDPEVMRRIIQVPVLFWDDFSSTATPKDWQAERVEAIISQRDARQGVTVWTSNEPLSAAGAKWGARVASRIAGAVQGGREVAIIDHDWRTGLAYGEAAAHA